MADGDESLLDVFVNIRPDPNFQDIIRTSANEAIAEYARIFSTASIPSPRIGPPNVSGGGSGGGGGGSSGGGGTSGGGRGGLAQEYRDAARALEDLQRNLRTVSRESSLSGIVQFDDEVKRLQDQLSDLVLNVRRQTQDRDLLGIQASMQYVEPLRQEILRVFQDVSNQRPLKEQFDLEVRRGREEITTGRTSNEYEASLTRGSLASADTRRAIALIKFEVKSAEEEVRRLSLAFNGTSESVENLSNATQQLAMKNQELKLTYQQTQEISKSMNTLSNNAYQLGQAFEDFSVGYSLNGFAGGIRGAANNVAFLLNDMSRLESVQKALPAGWAKQLPLIAGIGSALAIVVLPKIVEWLESLNDIEGKFEDISEQLKTRFEDIEFGVKFNSDNAAFERALLTSTSVLDVLKQISDLDFESKQKGNSIKDLFEGINQGTRFEESSIAQINEQTKLFEKAIAAQDAVLQENARKRRQLRNADFPILEPFTVLGEGFSDLIGFGTAEGSAALVKELKTTLFTMQREINAASEEALGGRGTAETFVRAQNSIATFRKTITENIGLLDMADDKALESFNKTISVLEEAFKKSEAIAREQENIINNSLEIAFGAATVKVRELQDQLDLSRAVTMNVNVDFDLDLLALDAQINEGRRILTDSIKAIRDAVPATPEREAGIQVLEEEFRVRSLLSVEQLQSTNLKEREKIEERILEIKERQRQSAKFTNLEEFARTLQINALSGSDEDRRRKKKLADLQDERSQNLEDFKRITEARDLIESGRAFGDVATRQRTLEGTGTGFMPFFLEIAAKYAENAMDLKRADGGQAKPEEIKNAISEGVREGMKAISDGFGGKTVDALGKLKGVAVAQ